MTREGDAYVARRRLARYVAAGVVNTAITYVLLLAAMRSMDYRIAYTLVYVVGIALAYVLQSRFVFEVPLQAHKAFGFPVVYLVQYLFGMASLWLLLDVAGLPASIAALLSIALNVPLGFVLSRFWLTR
jgi:putative flippase GtrA